MITIDLTGSTVLVTGAAGGLGQAIARRFSEAGATVVAHARSDSATLRALADELPGAHRVVGDLDDEDFVAGVFAPEAAHGPVHVLVNNAGSYPSRPLLDTSLTDLEAVLRSNVGITHSCTRYAARAMQAAGGGCIVNIGSLNVARPGARQAAYNSAKAAVVALTRSAAVELAAHGIRVNAVSPGLIDRPGLAAAWPEGVQSWLEHCPAGRLGSPGDIADACVFLASPLAGWITGQELIVDGGISATPAY